MSLLCMLFSVAFCQIQISPFWLSEPLSYGIPHEALWSVCTGYCSCGIPVHVLLLLATGSLHMPYHPPGKFCISLFLVLHFSLGLCPFLFAI